MRQNARRHGHDHHRGEADGERMAQFAPDAAVNMGHRAPDAQQRRQDRPRVRNARKKPESWNGFLWSSQDAPAWKTHVWRLRLGWQRQPGHAQNDAEHVEYDGELKHPVAHRAQQTMGNRQRLARISGWE